MLVDDIAWALPELRQQAEALMVDWCTVERGGGSSSTFNPDTGSWDTAGAGALVYEGRCQVRSQNAAEVMAAEQEVGQHVYVVNLPWDTTGVARGDRVTVVESADPWLQDRTLTVTDVHGATNVTKRRLLCEWS